MSSLFPRRFGPYVLVQPLGRGGMGEVVLALAGASEGNNLRVLKRIVPQLLRDPEARARFDHEAKIALRLSYRNLVHTFAFSDVEGEPVIAQEFVEGRNLTEVQARIASRQVALPVPLASYVICEVARALEYAHDFEGLNLVHRDISPSNIRVTYQGGVKLMDFGMATSSQKAFFTQPGGPWGKMVFMAPEQFTGAPADRRSDLYALGVVSWELLAGRGFGMQEAAAGADIAEWANGPPPGWVPAPPSELNPEIPPELDAIVGCLLARRAEDRFQNATALVDALTAVFPRSFQSDVELADLLEVLFDVAAEREIRAAAVAEAEALRHAPAAREGDASVGLVVETRRQQASSNTTRVAHPARARPRLLLALLGAVVILAVGFFALLGTPRIRNGPMVSASSLSPTAAGSVITPSAPQPEVKAAPSRPPVPVHAAAPRLAVLPAIERARRAYASENFDEALRLAAESAREGGGAAAYLLLGNINLKLRKLDQAESAYRSALRIDPHQQLARSRLDRLREMRAQAASP